VHKPLPQAHIIPDNPGADRTTGRTGTTARTSAIVHPPPCSGLCLGWGGVMPGELLEGDRTPKPAPMVSATKPGEARHRGVRGVVPPGQHCGALGEGRPKGERAAFAAAWGYVDLNHGPRPYQGRALTD
jgi:hypothetical protein